MSSKIFLSATFLGVVEKNFHKKSKAFEDSEIYVGGSLGDAAIGLNILNKKMSFTRKQVFFR